MEPGRTHGHSQTQRRAAGLHREEAANGDEAETEDGRLRGTAGQGFRQADEDRSWILHDVSIRV